MPELNFGDTSLVIVKIATIIGLTIYNIFAFVVVRQVNLMTQTLKVDLEGLIKGIAIMHFIFSLGVLLYAIVI